MCLVTCGLDIVQVKGPASCSGGFPAVARERLALIQLVGYRPGSSGRWLRFPSCCRPEPALAATTWGRDSYRASTGLALARFPLGGTRPHCQPGRPLKQDLRREVTWPLVVCRERERERERERGAQASCPPPWLGGKMPISCWRHALPPRVLVLSTLHH